MTELEKLKRDMAKFEANQKERKIITESLKVDCNAPKIKRSFTYLPSGQF